MDGVNINRFSECDDAVDVEIGLDWALIFTDLVGFVGFETVETESVFFGIDGDGAEAEFIGGAEDADGDFATIEG